MAFVVKGLNHKYVLRHRSTARVTNKHKFYQADTVSEYLIAIATVKQES